MSQSFTGASSLAASALTGTVLASNVVTSSLTSVGTLTELTLSGHLQGTTGNGYVEIRGDSGASVDLHLTDAGLLLLGDTTNANMAVGLTVQQGANDDQAFCLKSSDVATGATTLPLSAFDIEADDYFVIGKRSAAKGGVHIVAIGDSTIAETFIHESWGGTPAITDTSGSLAVMNWFAGEHDNANADVDMAADSNAFAWGEISSAGARLTRMLLKADDGELHLGNTTLVALDKENDIHAVRDLQIVRTRGRGVVASRFDRPTYDYEALHKLAVIGEKDENGEFLIRIQPYLNLHDGAIWQLYIGQEEMKEEWERDRDGFLYVIEKQDERIAHLERLLLVA